jgi:hypothetical protein
MKTIITVILFLIALGCKKENIKPDLDFTNESFGCASFIVYKANDKNDATVAVIGDRQNLNLNSIEQTFKLSNMSVSDLQVEVRQFSDNGKYYYCNDVPSEAGEILSTWTGTEGTVKIRITQDSLWINQIGDYEYKINVIIEDVTLKNEYGKKISIDYLEFKEVYVGWLPG